MVMDGMNENPTRKLTDLLVSAFGPAASKAAKAKKSGPARSQKEAPIAQPLYRPLVEEDRLSFRAVTIERFDGDVRRKEMPTSPMLEKDLEAFRVAFSGVWSGIPCQDRHRLHYYWRGKHDSSIEQHLPANPDHRPVILVVDAIPDHYESQTVHQSGTELLFTLPMLWGDLAQLRMEIATALALTFRIATRQYGKLQLEMIDEPFSKWEKSQRRKVTYSREQKKLDTLEKNYLRVHNAEMADLLRSWGCQSPPPHELNPT